LRGYFTSARTLRALVSDDCLHLVLPLVLVLPSHSPSPSPFSLAICQSDMSGCVRSKRPATYECGERQRRTFGFVLPKAARTSLAVLSREGRRGASFSALTSPRQHALRCRQNLTHPPHTPHTTTHNTHPPTLANYFYTMTHPHHTKL